jgi:hypothetical protein
MENKRQGHNVAVAVCTRYLIRLVCGEAGIDTPRAHNPVAKGVLRVCSGIQIFIVKMLSAKCG